MQRSTLDLGLLETEPLNESKDLSLSNRAARRKVFSFMEEFLMFQNVGLVLIETGTPNFEMTLSAGTEP